MSATNKRVAVLISPRWAGSPNTDWYQTLLKEIAAEFDASRVACHVLDYPSHNPPVIDPEVQFIASELERLDWAKEEELYFCLVGHSVGNQSLLRFMDWQRQQDKTLLPSERVLSFAAVAGWFSVDKPWESLVPWLADFPVQGVFPTSTNVVLLQSDNDPFTSDFNMNAAQWKEKLGAEAITIAGGKHFNQTEEPSVSKLVLKQIREALA